PRLPGERRVRPALRGGGAAARRRSLPASLRPLGRERRAPLPPARRRGELRRLPGRRRARRPAARGPLVEGGNRDGRRTPESMSSRTCPDWPALMELAPDLQVKHYTVSEAHLPAEALGQLTELRLDELEICCDLEHNVVNPDHTDESVVDAL